MVVVITTSFWGPVASTKALRMRYQTEMSSSPKPTTVSPITAPDRKAIFRPALSELRAAFAVRAEAAVAVFIPINPANPEKNPPVRKANGTHEFCTWKP